MTFGLTSISEAIAIPVCAETVQGLDRRRLFALDHLASNFPARLVPDSEVARAALGKLAARREPAGALRRAIEQGAAFEFGPLGSSDPAGFSRGLVFCLHPRDLPQGSGMARRAHLPLISLLSEEDEENAPCLRAPGGCLQALVAFSYEEMVAGSSLGLLVPLHLILPGAAPSNLARVGAAERGTPGPYRVGVCPTASLAPRLGAISEQIELFCQEGRGRFESLCLSPPKAATQDPFEGIGPAQGWPPQPAMDGWGRLFALVAGGATSSDEEAILMCQARRVPVLALDGPVSRELIRDGRTGHIINTDNFEEVRARLSVMARFEDERRRVAEAARLWTGQFASPEAARALMTSLIRTAMVSSGDAHLAGDFPDLLDEAEKAPGLKR